MFIRSLLWFTVLFINSATPALAYTFKESKVGFLATGSPGFLTIKGEGGKLSGECRPLNKKKGHVECFLSVDLSHLTTGIDLRDSHMRDKYLEVKKHPKAFLNIGSVPTGDGEYDIQGILTIKGVSKPVTTRIKISTTNQIKEISAQLQVTLSDYPIGVPSYLGVTVAKEVEISVQALAE
jgi:polyisoprenoid-binding protein YceI